MINTSAITSAIGFGAVLLIAGIGVDYYQQSLRQEVELGELSVAGYIDTIKERIDGVRQGTADVMALAELKERQKAGARRYLPEAPNGWERRAWADGDNSQITDLPPELSKIEQAQNETPKFVSSLLAAEEVGKQKRLNAEAWVYQRGGDIVSVRAWFSPDRKVTAFTASTINMDPDEMPKSGKIKGWGVIDGVAFGKVGSFDASNAPRYTKLYATIGFGAEVNLRVRGNASDEVIREILNAIDFDGLNGLLPRPWEHVGKDAPATQFYQQQEMARKVIAIRRDLAQRRGRVSGKALTVGNASELALAKALREIDFGRDNAAEVDDAKAARKVETYVQAPQRDQTTVDAPAPVRRLQIGSNGIANCTKRSTSKNCVLDAD